jgi:hypothetical protein
LSAIAACVAALVAVASFFAGRATTSDPGQPTNIAHSSSQTAAAPPGSPTIAAATLAAPAVAAGKLIIHYTVDLADLYGMDVTDKKAVPHKPEGSSEADIYYYGGQVTPNSHVQIASSDKESPTYQDCAGDTRFTSLLIVSSRDAFCFIGHGYVAAFKVLKRSDGLVTGYATLDVSVWKGP